MLQDVKTQRLQKRGAEDTDNNEVNQSLNETSPFADDSNMDMDESVFSPDDSLVHADDGLESAKASSDVRVAISSSDCAPKVPSAATKHDYSAQSNVHVLTCPPKNDTEPLIGSLPPSDDPRVLVARRKLFNAIDTALATYSREILALARDDGDEPCMK
jgi:hypothetical protein